jgi:hypothetical protein
MNVQFGRLRPMYLHPAGQNLQRNRDRLWSFWVVSFENAAEKEKKRHTHQRNQPSQHLCYRQRSRGHL